MSKATPCRMIEAWALGDEKAIGIVGATGAFARRSPRTSGGGLGGRERSEFEPSKSVCSDERLVVGLDAEALEAIAHESRPEKLRKTCPESFAPFADEAATAKLKLVSK